MAGKANMDARGGGNPFHISPELATSCKEQELIGSQSPSRRSTNPDRLDSEKPSRQRLPELVDKLELALAKCLSDYRAAAEEALSQHYESIEEITNAHEHELASLTVENCTLREKLGLKNSEQLQQTIFQSQPPKRSQSKRGRRFVEDDDDPRLGRREDKGNKKLLDFRNNTGLDKVPGGSWQPFMAWVPNGAALQNPEPWKPLATEELLQVTPTPSRIKAQRGFRSNSKASNTMLAVLPGTAENQGGVRFNAAGEPKSDKNKDEDDSDSSSEMSCSTTRRQEFELLPMWEASAKQQRKMKKNSRSEAASSVAYREDDAAVISEPSHWFILNPDSRVRICWDMLSLIMIAYDIVMIPLDVFALPESTFLAFFDWVTRLFWTFDMGWSCITGVVLADGIIEYNFRAIVRRYVKSWFFPDLTMVLSDWAGLIFMGGGFGLGQLARVSRMARAVRLLRLLRMQEVLANLTERIQSDVVEVAMQIVKLVIILAVTSHFFACFWWAVGDRDTEDQTWVKENAYNKLGVEVQYLACLHWALSQFAGGTDEIFAVSPLEHLFAVLVGMTSFILALVMLGTLTSGLTQRHIIDGSSARQMATLKTYLRQNHIPKNLTKRLCRNAKHAITGDLTADSVQLLGVISEPLKVQMHFEMYARILSYHSFFHDLLTDGNSLMRRMCHQAMGMLLLASGDTVFELGEETTEPKLYIVASGTLDYSDAYGEVAVVRERDWVSEPVLWTRWRHQGTLSATSDVKMAMLDAQVFQDICKQGIAKKNPACLPIMVYAAEFVKELNQREHPTDLKEQ